MRYKFFTTSEKTWDAMIADMRSAQHSIYIEMYTFLRNTAPKHNFYDVLIEKARAGLKVVIIVDAIGSYSLAQSVVQELIDAGAEILFFKQWFSRTHRKLLIVDEKYAYVGGVNIAQQYISWVDLQMRLDGAIVKPILRAFSHAYHTCGGTDPAILAYDTDTKFRSLRARLLEHWPGKERNELRKHYTERIRAAKEHITIVSPYFIPHPWLMAELEDAGKRGVLIEIILPKVPDPVLAGVATNIFMRALHPTGVKFYIINQMLHAKALIVDDEATVGSHNIDALSFDFNVEAGIFFNRKDMVRDLKKIIETWKVGATLFDPARHKHAWYEKILGPIVRFLQPIL